MFTARYTEYKKFVRFDSSTHNSSVWVDILEVSSIEPRPKVRSNEFTSVLHMKNGHTIFVEESPDEVAARFKEE